MSQPLYRYDEIIILLKDASLQQLIEIQDQVYEDIKLYTTKELNDIVKMMKYVRQNIESLRKIEEYKRQAGNKYF